ncbi:MAG: RNA methyltransferase [Erysipelothrix sp.]|jgi:TrmH family RNA methyltransferase|nr:RNA methyltransferase [Erysipelothrix sp.]
MITSVNNEQISELAKLHQKKYRDRLKLALVDGEHLIQEAYKAKVLSHVYGLNEESLLSDISYTQVSESVMRKLCATTSLSRFIGVIKIQVPQPLQDFVLVLDGVQDPGNVGTLLRSALAFDFLSVICLPGCADPYGPKAIAASQGAIFQCSIHAMSLDELNETLSLRNYDVIVSDVHDAAPLQSLQFKTPCMLVLGSEGAGVSEAVKGLATQKVRIDTNHVESLNVATAGSILMHALFFLKG